MSSNTFLKFFKALNLRTSHAILVGTGSTGMIYNGISTNIPPGDMTDEIMYVLNSSIIGATVAMATFYAPPIPYILYGCHYYSIKSLKNKFTQD